MNKIIEAVKEWNKKRHVKNRDRLWAKLTTEQQLDLMLWKVNQISKVKA
jgi:hypothetical protein